MHTNRRPDGTRRGRLLPAALAVVALLVLTPAEAGAAQDKPTFVRFVGTSGAGAGQLDGAFDVDVDSDGNQYIADYLNDRVQVFGPTGSFLRTIGSSGSGATQLNGPAGLSLFFDEAAGQERLAVADQINDRIQIYALSGTHITSLSTITGASPTSINDPADIAFGPDGLVALADRLGRRVLVLSPSFAYLREIDLDPENPTGVAFSPSGDVLYVSMDGEIRQYDPDTGALLGDIQYGLLGGGSSYHFGVDEIGYLYLPVRSLARVIKVSPTGVEQWRLSGSGTDPLQFNGPINALPGSDGMLRVAEDANDRLQVLDLCPTGFTDVPESHPFWFEICWMDTANVSTGFANGTYRPASDVTRQAMAAFLYRAVGTPAFVPPATPTFPDVPTGSPFYSEVEWMAAEGIAEGFADGKFHPTNAVSRQAMSAFMYRAAGEPPFTPPGTPTFSDVGTGHDFFDEIEWMADAAISTGYPDGTYRPVDAVTRQAMSAFLARLGLIL